MEIENIKTKNECSQECSNKGRQCDNKFCENWIEYPEDNNCIDIALAKNDYKEMTYEQISKRMGITSMGAHYIEKKALKKIEQKESDTLREFLCQEKQ